MLTITTSLPTYETKPSYAGSTFYNILPVNVKEGNNILKEIKYVTDKATLLQYKRYFNLKDS